MSVKIPVLISLAFVFLVFGLFMMVTAYYQEQPGVFLALFFSSSFIILISGALIFGLIWGALGSKKEKD
ncbi:MAG: hypothetical protein SV487_03340 [Thermodesulfobacteriota bacterium]|nr:hypothetical protein [Thermodesulfobacteriota bacterium]